MASCTLISLHAYALRLVLRVTFIAFRVAKPISPRSRSAAEANCEGKSASLNSSRSSSALLSTHQSSNQSLSCQIWYCMTARWPSTAGSSATLEVLASFTRSLSYHKVANSGRSNNVTHVCDATVCESSSGSEMGEVCILNAVPCCC